jgi:hypothetical protein
MRFAERSGQASVELLASVPLFGVAGLVAFQLLALGYGSALADGAAEAGAVALAAGRPVKAAVNEALPGWARDRFRVEREGGEVRVRLRMPSPLAAVGREPSVESAAWARTPGAG